MTDSERPLRLYMSFLLFSPSVSTIKRVSVVLLLNVRAILSGFHKTKNKSDAGKAAQSH